MKDMKKEEFIYKNSTAFQCAACNRLIYTQNFENHKIECSESNYKIPKPNEIVQDQQFYNISVIDSKKIKDNNNKDETL